MSLLNLKLHPHAEVTAVHNMTNLIIFSKMGTNGFTANAQAHFFLKKNPIISISQCTWL